MSQAPMPLSEFVGYQLKRAQSALHSRMEVALRPFGLSTPQYACLELLRRSPGASSSELARGAFVTRQAMNPILRSLVDRGLVEPADAPGRGRAQPMTLTPAGHEAVTRAAAAIADIEARGLSAMTSQESEQLHRLLTRYAQALDQDA